VTVEFDGVYEHSTVWINGHDLGTRPYGYSTFFYELTPYLHFGDEPNVIAVRVDNSEQPNSRWYSGSGIDRHTWLIETSDVHFQPSGIYVTTPVATTDVATIHVVARIANEGAGEKSVELRAELLNADGSPAGYAGGPPASTPVAASAEATSDAVLILPSPRLWSPESPALYTLRTQIAVDGRIVDSVDTTIGVRKVEFDVNRGLLINGKPEKLRGFCIHQDAGAVGSAVPDSLLEHRIRLLKEMGCNAIRGSHNPMAPEFYDICDRLGMLVMDEAFDEWTIRKPQIKYGYSDVFEQWYKRDLVDFIRRDRNHPCVIIWSAGNEVGEQRSPAGPQILRSLVGIFHTEDPTRPVTAAMDNIFNQDGPAPDSFTSLLDVVGYNYVDRWGGRRATQYVEDREAHPARRFVGTEETGIPEIRGVYSFGPLLGVDDSDDHLREGKGPDGPLYVASTIRAAALWKFAATHDYVTGEFIWTGFDYLGESAWPQKAASFAPLDTCGFRKDSFYFYKSLWTSEPVLHLLPHWNWPGKEGSVVPVVAYTNCSAVELFLNGKSLGVKTKEFPSEGVDGAWNTYREPKVEATTSDLQLVWDVPYSPGELKAQGYNRNGEVVATTIVRTAQEPTQLEISSDRGSLDASSREVASITVRAVDSAGTFAALAANAVTFSVDGPAALIGVDNGDPQSHAGYRGNMVSLFNGMALGLVQTTGATGSVTVTVKADGLSEASVTLQARGAP
jgi:beta-galactosidase